MSEKRTERGQVLVLIILSIVVLLGFAALAVDGGRIYSERRRAQNAADTAAFAAAFQDLEGETAAKQEMAALAVAGENGFTTDGSRVEVTYYRPPISGAYVGNNQYHQVVIRTKVDPVFAQFVFSGDFNVMAEAVARARPVSGIFPGSAMHSSSVNACEAMWFSGTAGTEIIGGNVFSNSMEDGKKNCYSGQQTGSGSIKVEKGKIITVGRFNVGSGSVSPAPIEDAKPQPLEDVPIPDCYTNVTARDQNAYKSSQELQPGRYTGIKITNGDWTLKPGMYCVTDTGFAFNGGSLTGDGVMFVILGGDVTFNGGGTTKLIRPNSLKDGSGNEWGGMLIYMPYDNGGGVDLSGGSATTYTGTIYAPGPRDNAKSKCTVSGNSGSIGLNSNIICDTILVTGTAKVFVRYNEKQNFRLPPMVDLAE